MSRPHVTTLILSASLLAACDPEAEVCDDAADETGEGETGEGDGDASLPPGFELGEVALDDGVIGYVIGGEGPPLVLLHGWPQTWYEWHLVMPTLAERYTVVAPDLRGVGLSAPADDGFDKVSLASDVHDLLTQLAFDEAPILVGHDIGGMAAYAYATAFPGEASKIVIADVPIPGVEPFELVSGDPRAWHFGFHQGEDGIAELLVEGREREYIRWFINHVGFADMAISDADVEVFAAGYREPGALSAGFEWYRAFPMDAEQNAALDLALDTPMLLIGGEFSMGPLLAPFEQALEAKHGAPVETYVVPGAGHWVAEEQPEAFLAGLEPFLEG